MYLAGSFPELKHLNLLRILFAPWVATRVVATARNRVALPGENPRNEPQVLRIELRWMVFYHLCKPFPSCQLMTFSPPRKGIPICNLQKPLQVSRTNPQADIHCHLTKCHRRLCSVVLPALHARRSFNLDQSSAKDEAFLVRRVIAIFGLPQEDMHVKVVQG